MRVKKSQFGFGKKGGKTTPPKLDHLFQRHVIEESDYRKFWPRYWKAADAIERAKVVAEYTGAALPTKSKTQAIEDAARLAENVGTKYTVRRRNKRGQFSKRGRIFQAVRSSRRKSEDEESEE